VKRSHVKKVAGLDSPAVNASVGVNDRAAVRKPFSRVPVLQGIGQPSYITRKSKSLSQVTTKRLIGLQLSGKTGVDQKPEKIVREAIFTRGVLLRKGT